MTRAETIREAKEAIARRSKKYDHVCRVAAEALKTGVNTRVIAEIAPYLVEIENTLREMENVARFSKKDTMTTIRNGWAFILVDGKAIDNIIERLKERIVLDF